jgi:hypothetical protein
MKYRVLCGELDEVIETDLDPENYAQEIFLQAVTRVEQRASEDQCNMAEIYAVLPVEGANEDNTFYAATMRAMFVSERMTEEDYKAYVIGHGWTWPDPVLERQGDINV